MADESTWEGEVENAMLSLGDGEFTELHGVVVFNVGGIRGAMNPDDFEAIRRMGREATEDGR